MKSHFSPSTEAYDGQQLRSLYGYLEHGMLGDSIVAWMGACDIPFEHMVDGEDLRAQAAIRGALMVHFIIELFDCSLFAAVNAQRLFAATVMEELKNSSQSSLAEKLRREGDDLFVDDRKLSISIATVSPTSALIHFAVNVTNRGTPVSTLSLEDLEVDPKNFAIAALHRFTVEVISIREATRKVKWVR